MSTSTEYCFIIHFLLLIKILDLDLDLDLGS
jgi:hypothetical protein